MNGAGPHTGTGCRRRGALGLVLRGARGGERGTTRCGRRYLRAALRARHEASERIPRGQRFPVSSYFFFSFPSPVDFAAGRDRKGVGVSPVLILLPFPAPHPPRGAGRRTGAAHAQRPVRGAARRHSSSEHKMVAGPTRSPRGAGPSAWGCACLEAPRSVPNGELSLSISGPGRSLEPTGECRSEGRQEERPVRPEP